MTHKTTITTGNLKDPDKYLTFTNNTNEHYEINHNNKSNEDYDNYENTEKNKKNKKDKNNKINKKDKNNDKQKNDDNSEDSDINIDTDSSKDHLITDSDKNTSNEIQITNTYNKNTTLNDENSQNNQIIPPKNITPIINPYKKISTTQQTLSYNKLKQSYPTITKKDHHQIDKPLIELNDIGLITQTKKDSKRQITLPTNLESLHTVIMSQHNALESPIKNLGNICLNFTQMIEKKKDSSLALLKDERIPRSLRINCELTTSPSYENDPNYITLKQELQTIVNNFKTQGLDVMKRWSLYNIELLIKDRCHNILEKALHILDGLRTYWEDILYPIQWPEEVKNQPLLLLILIYFNTELIKESNQIINFLELSKEEILFIATKISTKQDNKDTITSYINNINLDFLNDPEPKHIMLITETLNSWNAILNATTVNLWQDYTLKTRQSEASQKLRAKMESEQIKSATTATSKAITKAMDNIKTLTDTNLTTEFRINNLERIAHHQKQTTNEILNNIKSRQYKSQQKNSVGSHTGSMTAPQNLQTAHIKDVVDLTMTQSQSPERETIFQQSKKRKTVQWEHTPTTISQYNPFSTPRQTFTHTKNNLSNTIPNPFGNNNPQSSRITFSHSKTLTTPPLYKPAPIPQISSPFQNINPSTHTSIMNPFNTSIRKRGSHGGRYNGNRRGTYKTP